MNNSRVNKKTITDTELPNGNGQSLLYSKIKNKERKSTKNVIVICYKATDEEIQ